MKPKNSLVLYKLFPRYIAGILLGLYPLLQVDYYVLYVADFFQNLYPVNTKKYNFTHTRGKKGALISVVTAGSYSRKYHLSVKKYTINLIDTGY